MSAQHTPGPWEAIEWKCRAATSVVVVRDGQMVQIAECSGFGRMSDECIADASLIAAAPDLLEALRGVLRVADRATVEFDAARAAIAKATGQEGGAR